MSEYYCRNCNARVGATDKYCPNCGRKFDDCQGEVAGGQLVKCAACGGNGQVGPIGDVMRGQGRACPACGGAGVQRV